MLRFETFIYCQLIGIVLLLGNYELKFLFNSSNLDDDPVYDHFKDIIKYNNSDSGIKIYMEFLVGLSLVLTFWRLLSERTPIDIITTLVSVPFASWYWTDLVPLEKFFYLNNGQPLFYKLVAHHVVFGLFVWTLFSLSILGSHFNYTWDPVELLILNVIGGMVIFDFTYDIPIITNPKSILSLQYGHVTAGVGTVLLDYVIPGLIVSFGIMMIYRIYQRSIIDFLLLSLFGVGGWLFVTQLLPIEKSLFYSGPSREKQKIVAYAHLSLLMMMIFYFSLKLTFYYGINYKLSRLPPPVPHVAPVVEKPDPAKVANKPADKTTKNKK